ncbi:M20 family metallopeptidase [Falsiroseomonas tokyonensis]|uniref:M20 family metallopeptidase n=1 Tax=Falsiroseomonas tokyonensis TaxID=430521 RepID=A0ABV7BPN7_9PROT|nr:M20 family metallopeptidase [Falsiroseomonas tokyonensis]MBU8537568.1 M20 family metallopeptidase [Falsiroseomonas tokyonensis]
MAAETDIIEWLSTQRESMIQVLREMVDTDGGSYDKEGVDRVGAQVARFMAAQGIPVETLPQQKHGDCIRAVLDDGSGISGGNTRKNILLMGHRDTVFPKGEPTRRPFTIEGDRAFGPGVADMKAGLVMNMFVLAAFRKFGGAPGPLVALFTGDEEIGSPEGRPVIEAEAKAARVVFNSEPGRPNGGIVTGRKGGVFSVFDIEGKAAHSGGNFEAGISAIGELAAKITAIHALTDLKRGITLNVGLVTGGQSVNTVAPHAQGQIDLRYVEPADREEVMAKIQAIIDKSFVPGTRAKLTIKGEFLPLTQSPEAAKLFATYRVAASESGFDPSGEFSGGCADSGFTAAMGAPTLCAVGPVGGKAHTPEEYLELSSLVPRAQAVARAILKLGPG